jgi:hypothetical protein
MADPDRMILRIRPGAVTLGLSLVVTALVALHVVGQVATALVPGNRYIAALARFVDLNQEVNLPSWYASGALGFCAVLLAMIARAAQRARSRYVLHWAGLAMIFCGLSLDELVSLHERTTVPLRALLRAGEGPIYYSWVVLGAALVAVIGFAYLPFLLHLSAQTRRLCVIAAGLFLSGALGMEMIEGVIRAHKETLTWALVVSLEEILEMTGVVVFAHALLGYLAGGLGEVRMEVGAPAPTVRRMTSPGPDGSPRPPA